MTWLANVAYAVAAVLYLPVLAYQMLVQKKNRHGWRERFGHLELPPPPGRRVWVHAVSLGEINAARGIVEELRHRVAGADVVVSTTTDTGYARAVDLFGREHVFRYPLDFSWVVHRVLDRVRPSIIILLELEVWPNLLALADRRGISVVVANGRLTERSCRRLGRLGPLTRIMFRKLRWVGAQDAVIAQRFRQVGVPNERVEVTGSVKWDTVSLGNTVEGADRLRGALGLSSDTSLWVCGSTGPGEEEMILDSYAQLHNDFPDLRLAIVPRKPERFDEVAALIERRKNRCIRRSHFPDHGPTAANPQSDSRESPLVVLGDTVGELRKFYALADVVFVGRSLVPMGGSDPMEVAALRRAMIVGPHTENFAQPVEILRRHHAVEVIEKPEELTRAVAGLLRDERRAQTMGMEASNVVRTQQGATRRTVDRLLEFLSKA